jgi:single-strand DNA-binding protein
MRGINKAILVGHATRDAELRHTQRVNAVSSIRSATIRMLEGEEEARFHTVVCWERLTETTAEYVKKGDPLSIEGQLQSQSCQDGEEIEPSVAESFADARVFAGIPVSAQEFAACAGPRRIVRIVSWLTPNSTASSRRVRFWAFARIVAFCAVVSLPCRGRYGAAPGPAAQAADRTAAMSMGSGS